MEVARVPVNSGRISVLDAIRGLLAIGVMCYHLAGWLFDVHLDALGSYAVYGFFVLSGFAMAWVYDSAGQFDTRSFFIARIARVVPLWWAATILTVLSAQSDFPGWNAIIENLTLLSALTPTRDIPLGGWTIELEVVFYLLFPMLVLLLRKPSSLAAVFVGSLGLRYLYVQSVWPAGATAPSAELYFQIPAFLVFFTGGMLAARVRRSWNGLRQNHAGGVAAIGLVALVSVLSLNWFSLEQLLRGPLSLALVVIIAAAIGAASMTPNPKRTRVRWVFSELGSISYATYLLHPLIYVVLLRLDLPEIVTFLLVIACTLIAAHLSYNLLERPAAIWIRRRANLSAVQTESRNRPE